MPLRKIIVLTDRPDRGRPLAEAARRIACCRIAGLDESWTDIDTVQGVIADVSIDGAMARRCLSDLIDRLGDRPMPLIHLMRTSRSNEMGEAERLGATACFPPQTVPTALVTALFCQIAPGRTMTDLLVEHSFNSAGQLLTDMFEAARSCSIILEAVDREIDPVLQALHVGGLLRWLNLVQAHDDMTVRHCLLVAGLVANFAIHLGLSTRDRAALVRAALVHDVGKSQIPLAILNKPGPLNDDEMAEMRTHAAVGFNLLRDSGMTDPLALAVTRHHHEMLDGSGYPDGLRGDAIPDAVRLLTICDIYAALIEHRPYRSAMSQSKALSILRQMTPDRLEEPLVESFSASLNEHHTAQSTYKSVFERGNKSQNASTVN